MKKFRVICRYEHLTNTGKEWTKWFVDFSAPVTDTPEELNNYIKEQYVKVASIDKITKLKHEYTYEDFEPSTKIIKYSNDPFAEIFKRNVQQRNRDIYDEHIAQK